MASYYGSVDGLAAALKELVENPVAYRAREITLRSIRVWDAPALGELLGVYRREAVRRREDPHLSPVVNEPRFGHLVAAAGLLLLLDVALLPALLDDPCTSQRLIDALNDVGTRLRERAQAVGGGFESEALSICDLIDAYYLCTPLQKPEANMRRGIGNLIAVVEALLDSDVSIGE